MDLHIIIVDLESCADVTGVDGFHICRLRGYVDGILVSVLRINKVNIPPVEEYVHEIEYYR